MNNLTKTATILDRLCKILQVLLKIFCIAALVGVAILAAGFFLDLDPSLIGSEYHIQDLAFLDLEFSPEYAPSTQMVMVQALVRLILGFLTAIISLFGIQYIRQILQPMTENQPFHSIVSVNLKKTALLSVILGICTNVATLVDQLLMVFVLDLPSLLVSEKLLRITVNFELDFTFLVVTALLLLLSYVFRYGEELQQLSDETL